MACYLQAGLLDQPDTDTASLCTPCNRHYSLAAFETC